MMSIVINLDNITCSSEKLIVVRFPLVHDVVPSADFSPISEYGFFPVFHDALLC